MKVMPAVRTAAKALFSSSELIGDGVLGNATDEWHRAPVGHGRQPRMDITEAAKVATHPGGDWGAEWPPGTPGKDKGRAPPRRDTGPFQGGPANRAWKLLPDRLRRVDLGHRVQLRIVPQ